MNTPIFDFLQQYSDSGAVRAHMPGHKGKAPRADGFAAAYPYDITEIKGADVLSAAEGIIAESEKNAASLFGTAATFYSAEGSTLCIQAMLAAVCGSGGAIVCGRNSHRAVINACVLLDIEPCPVYSDVTAESVAAALDEYAEKKPACVFITSPDYMGKIADVKGIADICHSRGLPLLADNAHGAYLAFLEKSLHPIRFGADMCCDSAHKTLPALTGGAYLHVGNELYTEKIRRCMSLFGSTSPSYLILASMDLCNKYLAETFRSELAAAADRLSALKERLGGTYSIYAGEPLKLTIYALPCGLTGYELANRLRDGGIEPEYADFSYVVMMFSASNTEEDFFAAEAVLKAVKMPRVRIEPPVFTPSRLQRAMRPREAFFAESEAVAAEASVGRIAADAVTVCPPCIPIAEAGEVIDKNTAEIFKLHGISHIRAVKG